eukprot:NODE_3949_length_1255_cov_75.649293_g3466_i0.p1 GENE.NODE_3949_length_1255_cov_75.649293_g3466_i0~~NODE_3949_length_1255_cov_75.649293_g3466_i0.p1  ORF type:complete len:355 (-),score=60.40 NODE_3949_length_1255_cov_75.649293_g3466_i0:189-1205(-)
MSVDKNLVPLAIAGVSGLLLGIALTKLPKRKKQESEMKVLVFGSRGWIGGHICRHLERAGVNYIKASSQPGKEDDSSVIRELDEVKPTHVISVVGRTHGDGINTIDFLEGGPEKLVLNVRDNLYAPLLLARLTEKRGIHLTYFGTGCIFKYEGTHQPDGVGKTEDDLPNFFGSSYSVVKGFTDRLMHHWGDNVLNLRIRMPVSDEDHPRNFITKIANYQKVINIPNAMTYLPELLTTMIGLMKQKRTGTLNYVNPGVIAHKEILDLYDKIVDPNHVTQVFTLEEQRKILAADRSNCKLDTTKLEQWAKVMPVRDAIAAALEGIKEQKKKQQATLPSSK